MLTYKWSNITLQWIFWCGYVCSCQCGYVASWHMRWDCIRICDEEIIFVSQHGAICIATRHTASWPNTPYYHYGILAVANTASGYLYDENLYQRERLHVHVYASTEKLKSLFLTPYLYTRFFNASTLTVFYTLLFTLTFLLTESVFMTTSQLYIP